MSQTTARGYPDTDLKGFLSRFTPKRRWEEAARGWACPSSRNVMRDHKGFIDVTSDGNGTLFELYFQASRDALLENRCQFMLASYKGSGETILIVDDIESQREITAMMLDMLRLPICCCLQR
ncbi:MAG: hypothetical protein R2860_14010 [Desulfobacterales bacterium]